MEKLSKKVLTKIISKKWISIIVVLVVMAISFAFSYPVLHIKYSIDISQIIPRKSFTLKAVKEFGSIYGNSLLSPYYVIFNKTSTTKDSLLNAEYFNLMKQFG
jgi:predicted RND superfamily exporter protein